MAERASFRDPSGQVFVDENVVFRTVMPAYTDEWEFLHQSGLLAKARECGLIAFEPLPREAWPEGLPKATVQVLQSPKLPFISMPCEWCFGQLRDAALLTLDMHMLALAHGCILKDASAYNVQFDKGKPVFIDVLSFERWQEGQAWQAYGQFCRHFLAPLALMSKCDVRTGLLSQQWIDGIPLDLASKLLPWRTRLSLGLNMHLHLHAKMQRQHGDSRSSGANVREMHMTLQKMQDVAQSLKDTILGLALPAQQTEWGDYYSDTNYTATARKAKEEAVSQMASSHPGRIALDLGANTGEFSRLLAPHFGLVLASDYDHTAVEKHWQSKPLPNVMPLLLDLANPSPAYGWACNERASIVERCSVDLVMALALCHHLRFTFGIPFLQMATFFRSLLQDGGHVIVEFVPKNDSQVMRLLANRDDIFDDYTEEVFLQAFLAKGFVVEQRSSLPESGRVIFLFQKSA